MTEDEALDLARSYAEPAVPISLSELENYLARAADMLRGSVDQADFKAYIFPLMFFKRISDVYAEEFAQALAESGGDFDFAEFDENHRFVIPDGHSWEAVRERTENIGAALQAAFREIENANPDTLYGVFGSASWTNKEKLPDAKLADLIEHFSSKTLSNAAVSPDVFGNAYEYLIKRFADQSNKKAGEYYTPRSVVGLLVNILDPQEGESIYDPACGTGGMLIEVIKHVEETGGNAKTLLGKLYGQEKVLTTSAIAKMNLLLHGIDDFNIAKGDTLREPAFFTGSRLAQFDCVVANPPFSLKKWGHDQWADDKWGRNKLGGVPPTGYADWAWVQHMITSATPDAGRIAVVLPQGALFRQGAEAKIRTHVLNSRKVEAVIGLGPNLFYGTGLAACILVLRNQKDEKQRDQVLFINGEKLYRRGRNQNTFEPEHAEAILTAYRDYEDVENLAKVATIDEIKSNNYNLNIRLYVQADTGRDEVSLTDALARLETAQERAAQTRAELEDQLAQWGLSPDHIAKEVSS